MALRIYKKKLDYSYTFGIYPTIELLEVFPEKVKTVLLHPDSSRSEGVGKIIELCKKHDINFDTSPKAINKIASKENTMVIGVFEKYRTQLTQDKDHVVLVNPSDMGNVGTIIRTILGFGINNLVLIRPAVDIFDPRVVRSSMGSLFNIEFKYFANFNEYRAQYNSHVIYPFLIEGKRDLRDTRFDRPCSLVFGNEGSGLDDSYKTFENTISIKHNPKIDSLNLSVSVGIALFQYSAF